MASDEPRPTLLIQEPDFRLVRVDIGTYTEHVLELRDKPDAMGGERWRKVEINGTAMKELFKFLIRIAEKERVNEHRQRISIELPQGVRSR